jgi:hypothetical protein
MKAVSVPRRPVSEMTVFETLVSFLLFPEQAGYRVVSKPVSKSKFQNLTAEMSFDTILVYATEEVRLYDH